MRIILSKLEEWAIAILLALMTLITFSQVIARYVFDSGAVWALEVTTYIFAWLVILGASYCVKIGSHISIDVFVNLFPRNIRQIMAFASVLFSVIYCGILFYSSWDYISILYDIEVEMEDLPVMEWKAKIILPIGFALILYRLLELVPKIYKNEIPSLHFYTELESELEEQAKREMQEVADIEGGK